jgi:hypothetical protein
MFTDSHLLAVMDMPYAREAILRAFNEGDDAQAAYLIRALMERRVSATTPERPTPVETHGGQVGLGQEGLSVESEVARLFALKSLAGETP